MLVRRSCVCTAYNRHTSQDYFEDAYEKALSGNLQLRSSDLAIRRSRALTGTAVSIGKTGVFFENEDVRPTDSKGILKIGLSQSIEWPGIYTAGKTR